MKQQPLRSADISVGELQFFDNYLPALEAGNYFISVKQELTKDGKTINGEAITAVQEFIVSAPQFTIDPLQIINKYPPAGSTGTYELVLPHIVLKDAALPWDRELGTKGTPWLTLMVFTETDLHPGENSTDQSSALPINEYLAEKPRVLTGKITKDIVTDGTTTCRFISMAPRIFRDLAPRIDELPYLSHVRRINTGNRPLMGINEHGLFSVITANRFATAAAVGKTARPVKNIVHLVSLEGMAPYLVPEEKFSGYDTISLITLASWTFLSVPDSGQDFTKLASNLVQWNSSGTVADAAKLWLRLPFPGGTSGTATTEVSNRLTNGFVPLSYHTRSGENTFAWYRGPLTPVLPDKYKPLDTFTTADSALIFDKTNGVFDASLAAAWETGRQIALADGNFLKKLISFRKQAGRAADQLFYQSHSAHFRKHTDATVQENLLKVLTVPFIEKIGQMADTRVEELQQAQETRAATDFQAMTSFFDKKQMQQKLLITLAKDVQPLADWCTRLALLYPLPFDSILPDERMLPVESIRFFYVDSNWINAAIDGALSLAIDSEKQAYLHQVTRAKISDETMHGIARHRAAQRGIKEKKVKIPGQMSGFLLRSALVSGWPNLSIHGKDAKGNDLKILRIDHLSINVLLCIFNGIPSSVELCEPQEALGFGTGHDGAIVIRKILNNNSIGNQISRLPIRDPNFKEKRHMRSAESNVLHIAPTDKTGLIKTITDLLQEDGQLTASGKLTAATFNVQLVKSAEAIVFKS